MLRSRDTAAALERWNSHGWVSQEVEAGSTRDELLEASKEGDIATIVERIETDYESVKEKIGRLAAAAASEGQLITLLYLIGVHSRCKDSSWASRCDSPLLAACRGGWLETVRVLVERTKPSLLQVDQRGFSPACLALQRGHLAVFFYLVKLESTLLHIVDYQKRTLLHWACLRGEYRCVWWLLREVPGIVDLVDLNGDTAIDLAKKYLDGPWRDNTIQVMDISIKYRQGEKQLLTSELTPPLPYQKPVALQLGRRRVELFLPPITFLILLHIILPASPNLLIVFIFSVFALLVCQTVLRLEARRFSSKHTRSEAMGRSPFAASCVLGALLGGHSTYAIYILPHITALSIVETSLVIVTAFSTIYLFYACVTSDPHFIQSKHEDFEVLITLSQQGCVPSSDYCLTCQLGRIPFQHHCRCCGRCLVFDHDCAFIFNCVGSGNRQLFILFLAVAWSHMTIIHFAVFSYSRLGDVEFILSCGTFWNIVHDHAPVIITYGVGCLFHMFLTLLLCQQLFLVGVGSTTKEFLLDLRRKQRLRIDCRPQHIVQRCIAFWRYNIWKRPSIADVQIHVHPHGNSLQSHEKDALNWNE